MCLHLTIRVEYFVQSCYNGKAQLAVTIIVSRITEKVIYIIIHTGFDINL